MWGIHEWEVYRCHVLSCEVYRCHVLYTLEVYKCEVETWGIQMWYTCEVYIIHIWYTCEVYRCDIHVRYTYVIYIHVRYTDEVYIWDIHVRYADVIYMWGIHNVIYMHGRYIHVRTCVYTFLVRWWAGMNLWNPWRMDYCQSSAWLSRSSNTN